MASTPPPALPLEILLLIGGHLSVATLSSFSRTCHSLHELLTPRLDSVFAAESTSILQWAAKRNLPATVERALIHVPHVPTNRWICTPWGLSYLLVNAVRKRQTEIVRVLLAHGIDPNRGIGESMPLVMAAHKRDMVIVRMLLEAGADVKKRCRRHGHTALNAAVFLEDQEMVDLMLKYSGAN